MADGTNSHPSRGGRDHDALIIGAGFSGMYQLHCLRDRLGLSALVLEAGDGVGGTWYWNRYPGARCDSESHSYCYYFSKALLDGWEWSERYPEQPEIMRYLNYCADALDLKRDIRFGARVRRARYDETENRWHVETESGEHYSATWLITAVGCLSSANVPKIPGLGDFRGEWYHTGQWPHEGVDFSGKRVGQIGTGSTGIQAAPVIAAAGKAPDRLPAHAELQRAGPQRAAERGSQALFPREPGRDPRDHALDAERPPVQDFRAQGLRPVAGRAHGRLRAVVGDRRPAVPRRVPGPAGQQGGERHGGRVPEGQDPRRSSRTARRPTSWRRSTTPTRPSARRSTPTISRPSTATTSPWSTCGPTPSSASRRPG